MISAPFLTAQITNYIFSTTSQPNVCYDTYTVFLNYPILYNLHKTFIVLFDVTHCVGHPVGTGLYGAVIS